MEIRDLLRGTMAASNLSLSLDGGKFSFQVEPRITRDRDGHGRNDGLKEKFSVACFSSVFFCFLLNALSLARKKFLSRSGHVAGSFRRVS